MGASASAADDINAPEIHHWYTKFMRECPSGQLSLYEFKTLLDLHGLTPQADTYVDQVFNTFDLNKVSLVIVVIIVPILFYCITCNQL